LWNALAEEIQMLADEANGVTYHEGDGSIEDELHHEDTHHEELEFEPLVAPTEGVPDESGLDFDEDDHL